jgi:hypothetical protein
MFNPIFMAKSVYVMAHAADLLKNMTGSKNVRFTWSPLYSVVRTHRYMRSKSAAEFSITVKEDNYTASVEIDTSVICRSIFVLHYTTLAYFGGSPAGGVVDCSGTECKDTSNQ